MQTVKTKSPARVILFFFYAIYRAINADIKTRKFQKDVQWIVTA